MTITPNSDKGFEQQLSLVQDALMERWGIQLGETEWLIHAKPLIGRKLQYNGGRPNEVKVWGETQAYPLQTTVRSLQTEDPRPNMTSIDQIFVKDCRVFILNKQYYGCIGRVKSVTDGGSVSVNIDVRTDIDMAAVRASFSSSDRNKSLRWMPGWRMAQNIGISSYILSRITGVLYIFNQDQKRNIGLGLRSNRGKGGEVPGFTRRLEQGEGKYEWQYSSDLQACLENYIDKYPDLIMHVLHDKLQSNDDKVQAEDIFPEEENIHKELDNISKFIKSLPCHNVPMQECGLERLQKDEVKFITDSIESFTIQKSSAEKTMSPKMLFYGLHGTGRTEPDGKAKFALWDRVVNCRSDCAVPLGWRGTVIGLIPESKGMQFYNKFFLSNNFTSIFHQFYIQIRTNFRQFYIQIRTNFHQFYIQIRTNFQQFYIQIPTILYPNSNNFTSNFQQFYIQNPTILYPNSHNFTSNFQQFYIQNPTILYPNSNNFTSNFQQFYI